MSFIFLCVMNTRPFDRNGKALDYFSPKNNLHFSAIEGATKKSAIHHSCVYVEEGSVTQENISDFLHQMANVFLSL